MIDAILGLGNIGRRYHLTRHNLGFDVLDRVATTLKAQPETPRENYQWATAHRSDRELVLAWPTTYMNGSGLAARDLLERHELEPSRLLVVTDDFNLPLGRIRFRRGGSDGGHNGLASIIEALGTANFPRLRLGIGPIPDGVDTVDFVLSPFGEEEQKPKEAMTGIAAEAVLYSIDHRFEEAMSTYNANPA